jgi:hypothetical protein
MLDPVIVTFTHEELEWVRQFAKKINADKESAMVSSTRTLNAQGQDEVNYIGFKGELAVGKWLDLPMNGKVILSGDEGFDFYTVGGTIEVRSTSYVTGRLVYDRVEDFVTNYAVLVVPHENESVRLAGWVGHDGFVSMCYPKDLGHGVRYVMNQYQLHPMSTFPVRARHG